MKKFSWESFKDNKKFLKFPIFRTKKTILDGVESYVKKIVSEVSFEIKEEYEEVMDELAQENISDKSLDSHFKDDPVYTSLYSSYAGRDGDSDCVLEVSEKIKWAQSKGYVTYFNHPLERGQSDESREYAQAISYSRVFEDPIIGAIPDTYQKFVLGRGVAFKFESPEIQSFISTFWRQNNMDIYLKELVWRFVVESEYFPLYFVDEVSGRVTMREIQPAEIIKIEINPEDKQERLSYCRRFFTEGTAESTERYYADFQYFDKKDENPKYKGSEKDGGSGWQGKKAVVQFLKFMKNREVRSRVFLERVLRWGEWYKNFVIDRAIINHEKGRCVWMLTIQGKSSKAWKRFKTAPAGGLVKVNTPNRKWDVLNAKIGADDSKEDGLFLLYQIAAGSGLPLHLLSQRVSEAKYASIRKGESAFTQTILDVQDTITEMFLKPMFRFVIKRMVEASNPEIRIKNKVSIRKFAEESITRKFNDVFKKYRDDELPFEKVLLDIKDLTERYRDSLTNKDADVFYSVIKSCNKLIDSCDDGVLEILEGKKDVDSGSTTVKDAYSLFKKGVVVKIDPWDCPVDISYPDLIKEDVLETAQVLKIHDEMGIASKQTLSTRAGYDGAREIFLRGEEDSMSDGGDNRDSEDNEDSEDNVVDDKKIDKVDKK